MKIIAGLAFVTALCTYAEDRAQFTAKDELIQPTDYREWIFLSSGLGMTYGPNAPAEGAPRRFDNVFVNPSSYRHFMRTGTWPDGTVLILEIRESESKGSINQHGQFQTGIAAIEANVKDSRRFRNGGWAFFNLDPKAGQSRKVVKRIAPGNRCEQCHSQHGAVDNTFVQFYPDLAVVAKKFGTFKSEAGKANSRASSPTPAGVPMSAR
jgi:hypothetical protein